jgi:hypothetical protein
MSILFHLKNMRIPKLYSLELIYGINHLPMLLIYTPDINFHILILILILKYDTDSKIRTAYDAKQYRKDTLVIVSEQVKKYLSLHKDEQLKKQYKFDILLFLLQHLSKKTRSRKGKSKKGKRKKGKR